MKRQDGIYWPMKEEQSLPQFALRDLFAVTTACALQLSAWSCWGITSTLLAPGLCAVCLWRNAKAVKGLAQFWNFALLAGAGFSLLVMAYRLRYIGRLDSLWPLGPFVFVALLLAWLLNHLALLKPKAGRAIDLHLLAIELHVLAIAANAFLLCLSGWLWLHEFNEFSRGRPTFMSFGLFSIGLANLVALSEGPVRVVTRLGTAMTRLGTAMGRKRTILAGILLSGIVVGTIVLLVRSIAERKERYQAQMDSVAAIEEQGGSVKWSDWWVVDVCLYGETRVD
ncbi:MAG: hypothetical protein HQ581_22600, partial [Planctomycetes bacterium]|nr:hypothetical protein [Planctomycetota bacterium]